MLTGLSITRQETVDKGEFRGQRVFITGSNRGLGKAIAIAFAKRGADLVMHSRKDSPEFDLFVSELEQQFKINVNTVFFDLRDHVSMKVSVKELHLQKLYSDILINSAGVPAGGLFQMTSMESIRDVFEINLFSQMELTQLLLRPMIKHKHGCVINLCSIAGQDLHAGNSAYGASKAALAAFTRTLAAETGGSGVRVNAVAPGLCDTQMAKQMENNAALQMIDSSSMKRLGKPEEIASVVTFLASRDANFINGQILRVDGGIA